MDSTTTGVGGVGQQPGPRPVGRFGGIRFLRPSSHGHRFRCFLGWPRVPAGHALPRLFSGETGRERAGRLGSGALVGCFRPKPQAAEPACSQGGRCREAVPEWMLC